MIKIYPPCHKDGCIALSDPPGPQAYLNSGPQFNRSFQPVPRPTVSKFRMCSIHEDKSRATRAPAHDPLVGLPLVFGQLSSETDSSTRGPSSCPPPPTWSRTPRSRTKAKADAASSVIQKHPRGRSQSADIPSEKLPPSGQEATAGPSKKRAVSAVAATTEHIQAPVYDSPTVSSGYANGAEAPVLTDGDTAMTQAEHLVLSALRIAETKESAVATMGKLPDLSVPHPFPGSAALGVTVGAKSPLLCPRSAGCTTKIVSQGESLAESATRMAIEEEMIESEQEEGLMGWLGSYQSGHSIDSNGLARLAPERWLNESNSAINFFESVIAFLGAEFESSPPLTMSFVNSVATEMMKLIDIEAMQRTRKVADSQVVRERGKATGGSTGSGNVDTVTK
uniref:Uncharacterized protein n=1 Tax=Chromera velia CCMP2878 TaxID=1169474 RepID=A0A0G4GBK8_9ALVE|eukprot:Cvel_21123.t1-p1 / transcript=Cvel_21123.t1 / gene=Cvel_21123 / organism=Chromera_velia_CCMP2878 / gene_product=hypothetical protein / transcript_product=hypothetical protein / location=Cvel_scaffold1956:11392-12570(-) / protein_length=393 / sequence_SO=supercontig / SO=protein_coding / is_pseudo=false